MLQPSCPHTGLPGTCNILLTQLNWHAEEEEREQIRTARELREFDTLLAEYEEKKRVDEWRRKTRGL